MKYSRRDLALLLPALAAAQDTAKPLGSKAFKFEELPSKPNEKTKSVGHAVFNGATHSGYPVELHITDLPAGASPHPPHRHLNEEVFMIKSGTVEVTVNGVKNRITPGSVCYINSNDLHGIYNPGPEPAQYFVIALGPKS
jgi:mannose-6-phosphate isomerase-like protein (cupin superfamily)